MHSGVPGLRKVSTMGRNSGSGRGGGRGNGGAQVDRSTFEAGGIKLKVETKTAPDISGRMTTTVTARRNIGGGEMVDSATAVFRHREGGILFPQEVTVEPALRRKGVASELYRLAQRQTGKRIIASDSQTPEGAALSRAFRSRQGDNT